MAKDVYRFRINFLGFTAGSCSLLLQKMVHQ